MWYILTSWSCRIGRATCVTVGFIRLIRTIIETVAPESFAWRTTRIIVTTRTLSFCQQAPTVVTVSVITETTISWQQTKYTAHYRVFTVETMPWRLTESINQQPIDAKRFHSSAVDDADDDDDDDDDVRRFLHAVKQSPSCMLTVICSASVHDRTRNTLDCDQSNYSSHCFLLPLNFVQLEIALSIRR